MDSVRARVLRGIENSDGEDQIEMASRAPSTHLRDILSDRPGRSFSSGAKGMRSGMEPGSDPVLRDMQDFAAETAEFLEKHRRAGDFARLVILAEPRMLGVVRSAFPSTLLETVVIELPVNLMSLSERALRERVREYLRNVERA